MDNVKHLLWYDHYKGPVYPLDLSVDPDSVRMQKLGQASCIGSSSKNIASLVHLCANFIVRDSTLTEKAISVLPTTLFLPLIQEALLSNKDRALNVLISHWPAETLSLKNLIPSIFASILTLYDSDYLSNVVRRGVMCTTNLAHGAIHMLQEKTSTSKLKYLDLTGYPTAEVMLEYITSSCVLAHSEQALVERINKVMEYSPGSTTTYDFQNISYVLPHDSCLHIKLDAFVTSWSCYAALCKALKVSTFDDRNLRLCIERLGVTCLGHSAIGLLLKQLDTQHLQGLQLKYNSLNRHEFVMLAPVLKRFAHLTALDLSCNCIYFWDSDLTCVTAANVFGSLRDLIRLDLSNSRIKTKLRRLLADIPRPLEYVRLAGCSLTVSDIAYLSLSHHTARLSEVDLSENNLGPATRNLCHLLTSCATTLSVLEIQECGFNDTHLPRLQESLSQLSSLLYLNFADNSVSVDHGKCLTRTLARLEKMQMLKFSFPHDLCEVDDGDSEKWERMFTIALAEIVSEECEKVGKSKPLRLILCEREPAILPVVLNL